MTAAVLDEIVEVTTGDGDDTLGHVFCCDTDTALCGADISDAVDVDEWTETDLPCLVCEDLNNIRTASGHALTCVLAERVG